MKIEEGYLQQYCKEWSDLNRKYFEDLEPLLGDNKIFVSPGPVVETINKQKRLGIKIALYDRLCCKCLATVCFPMYEIFCLSKKELQNKMVTDLISQLVEKKEKK